MSSNGVKIEKGVPIPKSKADLKWPWDKLKVGESFLFPIELLASARSQAYSYGKKLGRHFTTRTVDGGARVWRDK